MGSTSAYASHASAECGATSGAVGPWFVVHGRLTLYNGWPDFVIWKIGSNRLLGVLPNGPGNPESSDILTDPVAKLLNPDPDGIAVFGDYRVCPLTPARPGQMQLVYILDAVRLVSKPFPN